MVAGSLVSHYIVIFMVQTDPSAALEECIISILIAIARHSPTCANAIMMCQRLVQTVVDRFTTKDPMEVHLSKIKSVTLLKVSNFFFIALRQAVFFYYFRFFFFLSNYVIFIHMNIYVWCTMNRCWLDLIRRIVLIL